MKAIATLISLLVLGGGYYGYTVHEQEISQSAAVIDSLNKQLADASSQIATLKADNAAVVSKLAQEQKANAVLPPSVPAGSTNAVPLAATGPDTTKIESPAAFPTTITTIEGKTYTDCVLSKVTPDGISFTHSTGIAKVLFTDLDPSFAKAYNYDPVAAQQYEQAEAARESKSDADRAAYDAKTQAQLAAVPTTTNTPAPAATSSPSSSSGKKKGQNKKGGKNSDNIFHIPTGL